MKILYDLIALLTTIELFKTVFVGLVSVVCTCIIIYFVKKIISMLS